MYGTTYDIQLNSNDLIQQQNFIEVNNSMQPKYYFISNI